MKQAALILFFLMATCVQAASVRGKVTDSETGEELTGAFVLIKELGRGSSVGLDGTFVINNVPAGKYTLVTSFVSYQAQSKTIEIESEETKLSVDIRLLPAGMMQTIEIEASKDMSSENSARGTEKEAGNVMNVVSARAIELSPDLNVANVLQRMSGMTLDKSSGSGGQYALLRGMDKRYNYTLVNGIKIPSTNNKHRYVPLDIFPADLVDRIEVTKAITADMEGDAIAGAVNLVMKSAPDKLLIQTNASLGFSQFFAGKPMYTFDRSAVKRSSPYETNPQGYNAIPSNFSKKNLDLEQMDLPVNTVAGLTIGNRFFKKHLGIIVSANYQDFKRGTNSTLFDDDLSRDGNNLPVLTDLSERTFYEHQQMLGAHSRLDYRFNARHRILLSTSNIHFSTTQIRQRDETSLTVSYEPELGFQTRNHSDRFRLNLQNLFNSTLQGEHQLTSALSFNWSAVYSKAQNQSPDEATISYDTSIENFKQVPGYIDFGGATRIWRHNTDEDLAGYLNLKYQARIGKSRLELSTGGLYRAKTRSSFYNSYTLIPKNSSRQDSVFYVKKGTDWNTYSDIDWTVRNPRGSVGTSENFDALENVLAYYAMAKFNWADLQITGGVRIETTDQGYSMLFPMGEKRPSETYRYTDILPSVHFKYMLDKGRHNIRASYYKATNKPGFQEIVPFIVRGDDYSSAGNPDIKQAVADNADLRWEFYPGKLDQVMAGLFYKNIKNPIEYAFVDYLGNSHEQVYSPINSDVAVNYGLELDFTKYRRQWGIKANYTWTSSHITTNKLSRIKTPRNQDSTIYVPQTRPLFGQSAHVGNISLLYMGTKNGLSAQLAFSYTGPRLYTVSRYIDNDLWQKGFWQMDFSAEKRFKKGLSVFVKAQNLLNTHVIVYIKKTSPDNSDIPLHSASDSSTLVRSEYSQSTYLAGVRFKF